MCNKSNTTEMISVFQHSVIIGSIITFVQSVKEVELLFVILKLPKVSRIHMILSFYIIELFFKQYIEDCYNPKTLLNHYYF